MTRVTIDAALRSKLQGIASPVELCDDDGRVLGRFIPKRDFSEYEPNEPQVSDEELRRRAASTEWYTTAEVLAFLEKL